MPRSTNENRKINWTIGRASNVFEFRKKNELIENSNICKTNEFTLFDQSLRKLYFHI